MIYRDSVVTRYTSLVNYILKVVHNISITDSEPDPLGASLSACQPAAAAAAYPSRAGLGA